MTKSTAIFHQSVLRLTKGVLKAYETWLESQPEYAALTQRKN
jgi:hypothetical protein